MTTRQFLILLVSLFVSMSGAAYAEENIRRLETMSPGTKITWRFPLQVYANMSKVELLGLIDVKGVGSNIRPMYRTFLDEFRNGWWYVPAFVVLSRRGISGTMVVDHVDLKVEDMGAACDCSADIYKTTYIIYMTSGEKLQCERSKTGRTNHYEEGTSVMYFDDFAAAASPIFSSVVEP